MLQSIREYSQGWIATLIISAIIFTFVFWGIHSYFGGGVANQNVAEVNGVDITKEQFSQVYDQLRRQLPSSTTDMKETGLDKQLKQKALQQLVSSEVLKQSAIQDGFYIADQQIDDYLQSMPMFQVDGQFSLDRFHQILSSNLLSTSEFIEMIRTNLLINQPRMGIASTSFAIPSEVEGMISLVNEERSFDYLMIPYSSIDAAKIQVTPKEIEKYYQDHQKEFTEPAQVDLNYVLLDLADVTKTIQPTEAALKSYYQDNINNYAKPIEWKIALFQFQLNDQIAQEKKEQLKAKANELSAALKHSSDFKALQKKYDVSVKELGPVSLTQIPEPVRESVSHLTETGMVSKPILTDQMYYVVKVISVSSPVLRSYEESKESVKAAYIKQQAEDRFANLREQMGTASYEHPDSLQYVADALHLPIKKTPYFTLEKSAANDDISQDKKVREIAFSSDVLSSKNNSDVISIAPGKAVVVRVNSSHAASVTPLSSALQAKISDTLKKSRIEALTEQLALQIKGELEKNHSMTSSLISAHQLKWVHQEKVGRYSNKIDPAVSDIAFTLVDPAKEKLAGQQFGVAKLPNAYALVTVRSVTPGKVADNRQMSVYAEQYKTTESMLEYQLYQNSLVQTAKVIVLN